MKNRFFIRILITFLFAFIIYYITLPAFNVHNIGIYFYCFVVFLIYKITGLLGVKEKVLEFFETSKRISIKNYKNKSISFMFFVCFFGLILVINFVYSPLFMSEKYSNRIIVNEDNSFEHDIKEVDFNKIPLLDKDSSSKLGDRVMGQMSELVSQFEVSSLYTQINYNSEILRVTPLEYASGIKWLTNRKDGVKGYITVNSVDGESKLVKLDKGMKYVESALFNENLYRKLRFSYPTKIFDSASFEIDNDGKPFWIVPSLSYKAINKLEDVEGVVILDPITGESDFYEVGNIPSWVDQVYKASLIINQFDDKGMYKNGFINSIFSQKGVVQTTDGYNYMIQDDDVYLYTGVTSISNDESNIGFIISNLRTKETKYYNVPGAEEYSAMDCAKGQVQQMEYESTFPLLINLNNRPTYLISLKDNAGLVKMYSFVDVEDYQKVSVSDASIGIEEASRVYFSTFDFKSDKFANYEKEIVIDGINSAIIDGVSYYFLTDRDGIKYKVSIKINEMLPFLKKGDTITVKYVKEKEIIDVVEIK